MSYWCLMWLSCALKKKILFGLQKGAHIVSVLLFQCEYLARELGCVGIFVGLLFRLGVDFVAETL